jgi:tripartite-type tricarboxylate transporter receptor subunit TctC
MLILRFVVCMLLVCLMVFDTGVVSGQNYPTKTIRVVCGNPGNAGDLTIRLIASRITNILRQQMIVDNRGAMAMQIAAKARPDGYTLLSYGSVFWIMPLIRSDMHYDPVRDFVPITMSISSPNVLVVHPSVPAKSVEELIALAKSRPGKLNCAMPTVGSSNYLAAELFMAMAGINMLRVPYKGSGPALNALIGGETQVSFPNAGTAAPHIQAGRLRALAVSSDRPSDLAPGLPTIADSGLPGYESSSPVGIFAPAGTPAQIIRRLNQEIVLILNRADVKERLFQAGVEVIGSSPEQCAAMIKSEMVRYGKVIKDAGIHEE